MITIGERPYLECSTRGDTRFSALCARIHGRGGRTIEDLYQAAKIFPGGVRGLPANQARGLRCCNIEEVRALYSKLWDEYIAENPHLLVVLRDSPGLSDWFGKEGHACQALELWRIRNGGTI